MPRALPRLLLLIHALLVLLFLVAFLVMTGGDPAPDANIGAGLVGLALLGLGLPWSLLHQLIDSATFDDFPRAVRIVLMFGPAVLNVVVHSVFVLALERRDRAHRVTKAS